LNAAIPQYLRFRPNSVVGGATTTATLSLTTNAPAGGAVVTLQRNKPAVATVPATVTVPAGQKSATFTVTTFAVAANTNVQISATYGLASKTAILTVTH
jgi:hypothetical protein